MTFLWTSGTKGLIAELSSCEDYFLRLSEFLDLFDKVFPIAFKISIHDFSTIFLTNNVNKTVLTSFVTVKTDHNGYNDTLCKLNFFS